MKILVAGAGPAGLYFSYLAKRRRPGWRIRVVEQNPPDATFGFGVVFSDRALEFLHADDPATYDLITPELEAWIDLVVVHRGVRTVIDGIGFTAIGRLRFLRLMQRQLASVGVTPEYGRALSEMERVEDYDLVVAADGANSAVRRSREFGTTITHFTNKFAWYGTPRIGAPPDRGEARGGSRRERRVVRPVSRSHETHAARVRVELYSAQRPGRVDPERLARTSPKFVSG